MQAIKYIDTEQPLKGRGILDDEFSELRLICLMIRKITMPQTHTYAYKAKGVDPSALETKAVVYQQALQGGAPGNQATERALRDAHPFKRQLLKLGEVKPLDGAVREEASPDGDNTEGR